MLALEHEMLIALHQIDNKIRDVPPLVPFTPTNLYDSWSTYTNDYHNSLLHPRSGNVLERFLHTEMQEGQPLGAYVLQVITLVQSLDPHTS